jgi:excisionase family DNA binding protein
MSRADTVDDTLERLKEIAAGRVVIRTGETLKALGIGPDTLNREISEGKLRYVLIGKHRRFKPSDIAHYLERQAGEWQHQRESGDARSSSGAAGSPTKTSVSTVVDFESAWEHATRRKPKPSRSAINRRRFSPGRGKQRKRKAPPRSPSTKL